VKNRILRVAPLLFGSGMCALIYQTVWLRELRLVFGASTPASAAVIGIFMAGLGLGGLVLGRKTEAAARPLLFYANLEALIALSAAATPGLLWLVRHAYVALGGSVALGQGLGTLVRLLLSMLVLGVPTVLMGGTLPAASKAIEDDSDDGRRLMALLYGANTVGAVLGATLSTFALLEIYGTRQTLWIACLVNAVIAVVARVVARSLDRAPATVRGPEGAAPPSARSAPSFVLGASAVVGFVFMLMELVWYRTLSPLLGGSTYTFGLILAIALAGIGLGGIGYALRGRQRPATLWGFALTCSLEAAFMALPIALGDRIAFLALMLRPLGGTGFLGTLMGWGIVVLLVVLPAAFISGIQFPLLVALLGRGSKNVGRHVGLAYAFNTLGSIVGSLAGGFGLLPVLGAIGAWKLAAGVSASLGVGAALLAASREKRLVAGLVPVLAGAATLAMLLLADGPTAAWRHSAIGAGRASISDTSVNGLRAWSNRQNHTVMWEADGLESGVALSRSDGLAFLVNGKSDGHSTRDGGTQVMSGILGAILHPEPKKAMVIGLGTGSTAGWLASVPSIARVDVVEIEPAILHVAQECAPVNRHALENPKLHVILGDAREVLLTARDRYDLIFSEPSNPYRAGISSLYTREYYAAVRRILAEGGVFLQWLQAYEVDASTVRTVLATLSSEFAQVEVWQTLPGDLILVASARPIGYPVAGLRERIKLEPFSSALKVAWRATDLEGVLAHFLAGPALARKVAEAEGDRLNTDDQTLIEFAFARNVGRGGLFKVAELSGTARLLGAHRPEKVLGEVAWDSVDEQRQFWTKILDSPLSADSRQRLTVLIGALRGDYRSAIAAYKRFDSFEPHGLAELEALSLLLADTNSPGAADLIAKLRDFNSVEADALQAVLFARQGKPHDATRLAEAFLTGLQRDPWQSTAIITRGMDLVASLARSDPAEGRRLYELVRNPFVVYAFEALRVNLALSLVLGANQDAKCVEALGYFEPHVPWTKNLLKQRLACYERVNHSLASVARRDLEDFYAAEAAPFSLGLLPDESEKPASGRPPQESVTPTSAEHVKSE
jgi:predicted membrane-bound spermidine synthase